MPEASTYINSHRYICFWCCLVDDSWTYDTLLKKYLTTEKKKEKKKEGKRKSIHCWLFSTDIKRHSVFKLTNHDVKVTIPDQTKGLSSLSSSSDSCLTNMKKIQKKQYKKKVAFFYSFLALPRWGPSLWKEWKILKALETVFPWSFFLSINFLLKPFSIFKPCSQGGSSNNRKRSHGINSHRRGHGDRESSSLLFMNSSSLASFGTSTKVETIPVLGFFTKQHERRASIILVVFKGAVLVKRELLIIKSSSWKK